MEDYLNLKFGEVVRSQNADYSCLQRLGSGGTAEAYLMMATKGALRGQLFALKMFRRLSKPEWRENFVEEVKFLSVSNHPAIMRVYDEGIFREKYPFVVAEYLPDTLRRLLQTTPIIMAKLTYAVQLISALEYLSKAEIRVVHRDIKPANIFIKGSSCVLGDFGLIKRVGSESGEDREMLKSSFGPRMPRNYRTPDLIEYFRGGAPPTPKSDIYQLGLVFAEMFSGKNPQRMMETGDFCEPIRIGDFFIAGGLWKELKNLILPMLEPEPANRPSAEELATPWLGLLLEVAKVLYGLDGRVI